MAEYLDPEIANEGVSAETSWAPSVAEAQIPSYKGIKSILKYFPQFSGRPYQHQTYPCWFYHPTEEPRLVQNIMTGEDPPRVIKRASELAKELGCVYRESTMEEKAQGFPANRWVYSSEWRATPYHTKFNPLKPDTGKHVVSGKEPSMSQSDLIATTVAAILAKMGNGTPETVPEHASDKIEFEAFKAWKKSLAAPEEEASNALSPSEEDVRSAFEAEAISRNIKIDRRWSLDRLKAEIEKAA
jgi:hypothetical protein